MATLTAAPAHLTHRSAVALAAAIRAGEVSARDVVEAHIARIERVQPRLNAIVADRFDAARAEADAADRRVAEAAPDEELPPLLGVPCTVKESWALRCMPNTAGLIARQSTPADGTAPVVARVMEAGAIPLGVTNTSEMCMWIESENRLYGRTRNAYDPARTAGGSSGGEGSIVGAGASPFGVASDIGGSIRLPSFFNGVFGHKPGLGVAPTTGHFPAAHGDSARMLAAGPLARRAEDLMPVLRAMAGPDGEDPLVGDVTLGDPADVDLRGLEVIVSEHATWLPIAADMRAARERAADALAAAGARVRHESLRDLRRAVELFLMALGEGNEETFKDLLAEAGAEDVKLSRAFAQALRGGGAHTVPTLLVLFAERVSERIPRRHVARTLEAAKSLERELDGLIGDGLLLHPPHARPAPKHGRTIGRAWLLTPAVAFNVLALPVTQVPLGLDWRGLPLGVQVVARRGGDHVAMAAALELERRLGGWVPPGWTEAS